MRSDDGMKMTFEYKVADVLKVLKKNRQKHAADFEKALLGYFAERKDMLEAAKAKLLANIAAVEAELSADETVELSLDEILEDVETSLSRPHNYLEHYDDMIEQLSMTSQETFKLDRAVFRQLVRDEWEWSRSWSRSYSKYLTIAHTYE